MASANSTNKVSVLKRLWGDKVAEPMYKASKALALAKKDTSFTNEGRYVVVSTNGTAGGSATFADAVASQDAAREVRFFVTHKKEYQVFSLQGLYMAQSEGNPKALVKGFEHEAGKARYKFGRAMARRFWGNGGGALGQLAAGVTLSSTTGQFRLRTDIASLERGDQIEFSSDDGTAVSPAGRRGAPDRLTLSGQVDRDAGTFTTSAALNTVSSISADDYVFRRGDYGAAMTGMRGWVPTSDPSTSESFFGTDRSLEDISRVSGVRVSSAGSKVETLFNAGAEAQINGQEPDTLFANPLDYTALLKELDSRVIIDVKDRDGKFGFKAASFTISTGEIKIVSEVDVPQGYGWLGNMDTVYLRTAGDAPRLLNEDGVGKMLRMVDDDAYQGRLGAYGNIFNEDPGSWTCIAW
jgi:hypothetical protein